MSRTKEQITKDNQVLRTLNSNLEKEIEKLKNTIGEQNDKLHDAAWREGTLKEQLKGKEPKPTVIQKNIFIEKLKGQHFTMKLNRRDTEHPKGTKIAGELCKIADVADEMTKATTALLENQVAGSAVEIEVNVTVI